MYNVGEIHRNIPNTSPCNPCITVVVVILGEEQCEIATYGLEHSEVNYEESKCSKINMSNNKHVRL